MGSHGTNVELKNPGSFQTPGWLKTLFLVCVGVGLLTFGGGLLADAKRAWSSFVIGHFFFLSLALGGVFFAVINFITGAMWSAPMRRVMEAFSAYLPVAFVSFIVLAAFGMHSIYHWTHPEAVKGDLILEGKAGYLNMTFFVIRNLVALGAWFWFAKKLVGNSLSQDQGGGQHWSSKNRRLSAPFLIVFAVTFSMASFDQLMSLDPHWFSTMFGVYTFSGLFYSTLAAVTIFVIYLRKQGHLKDFVNENHLHDLGKYLFAFTVFWAYIGFSQFMLIWYANMPEETGYFMARMKGGWLWVSVFLLVGKFMLPFFVLLPRDAKRNVKILVPVAWFMLVAQWVDLLWMVQPEVSEAGPQIGWIEVGTTLLFAGLFGTMVFRFLAKNNIVAIGDPRLAESVHHHHQ